MRELILGLEDELNQGIIDQKQFHELILLVKMAVIRVFRNYPDHIKEATKMTERKLKLLSEILQEKDAEIAERDNEIVKKDAQLAAYKDEISNLKARLSLFEAQQPDLAN